MHSDDKILLISGVRGDTRRYRSCHLGEQLRLAGLAPVVTHLTDSRLMRRAQSARIVVLHRVAYDRTVERLLNLLHRQSTLVVLDADDYLYDPSVMRWIDSPDFEDPVRAAIYRRELSRQRATVAHVDAISVSTDYLASLLAPFGKPVIVHRNGFSQEMQHQSQRAAAARAANSGRVVIGYASGTRTHGRDLAMIRPVIRAILERYPQVDFWQLGAVDADQGWGALQGQVRSFPLVPWRSLPARLALLDINLAPLVPQSPFNQAKSENKYMEAALVGVPTVATPTDAFAHAIRSGENGFLAATPAEWQASLEWLIENPAERRAMGESALRDVLAHYAPQVRSRQAVANLACLSQQLGKGLPDLALQPVEPDRAIGLPASLDEEKHPTNLDLALYSIRNRGLPILAGQVWVYFRRLAAPIFPFRRKGVANDCS